MKKLKIASWNVNSIKVRGEAVVRWLADSATDILFMQEIKSTDENFPAALFADAGYRAECHGQKTYNGVAVVLRDGLKIDDVRRGLPGDDDDAQARYIEIDCAGFTMAGIYLPNGNPVLDAAAAGNASAFPRAANTHSGASEKFTYKLNWMRRLIDRARILNSSGRPVLFCGDFNIIPDAADCHDIAAWRGDALHHPQSLALWRQMQWLGYTDAFRARNPEAMGCYTFWDYQGGAWQKDNGIRIDHFLTNPEATDRIMDIGIDKSPRGQERASDHTPIWCELDRQETR